MLLKNRAVAGFFSLILAVLLCPPAGRAQEPAKPVEKKPEGKEAKKEESKKGLPLKPERRIEFTTDEATWLSLDVAPDGGTILFELLGDLYTLPID